MLDINPHLRLINPPVNKLPDLLEFAAQSHEHLENVMSGALGILHRQVPRGVCERLCQHTRKDILALDKSTQVHVGLRGSLENLAVAGARLKSLS